MGERGLRSGPGFMQEHAKYLCDKEPTLKKLQHFSFVLKKAKGLVSSEHSPLTPMNSRSQSPPPTLLYTRGFQTFSGDAVEENC